MEKFILFVTIILLVTANVTPLAAQQRGSTSASMKVSVSVVETSAIQVSSGLNVDLNGERIAGIAPESEGSGTIRIPVQPQSEMAFSMRGEKKLTDENGESIHFDPHMRVSRNVDQEQYLEANGPARTVIITEPDSDNYRGIAEMELYGDIDAGEHTDGNFSTVYTVTAEHF